MKHTSRFAGRGSKDVTFFFSILVHIFHKTFNFLCSAKLASDSSHISDSKLLQKTKVSYPGPLNYWSFRQAYEDANQSDSSCTSSSGSSLTARRNCTRGGCTSPNYAGPREDDEPINESATTVTCEEEHRAEEKIAEGDRVLIMADHTTGSLPVAKRSPAMVDSKTIFECVNTVVECERRTVSMEMCVKEDPAAALVLFPTGGQASEVEKEMETPSSALEQSDEPGCSKLPDNAAPAKGGCDVRDSCFRLINLNQVRRA